MSNAKEPVEFFEATTTSVQVSEKPSMIASSLDPCGKGHACSFCPEEDSCQRDKSAFNKDLIEGRLAGFKWIILVMANKGGVGKSTVSANLAVSLAHQGHRVGLADADIHGPNAPRIFGLQDERVRVSPAGIRPPEFVVSEQTPSIKVGSLGFFLEHSDTPVVWRDSYKHDYIHQMIGSFDWGPLDFLVVDMPPGTGNELITLTDMLEGFNVQTLLVSSADAITLQDSLKASRFCKERGMPVMGLVENYAGTVCPHCGGEIDLFPRAAEVETFEQAGIPTLTRLPFAADISGGAAQGVPAACASGSLTHELFKPVVDACEALLVDSDQQELQQGMAELLNAAPELDSDDPEIQKQLEALLAEEKERLAIINK